MSDQQQQQQYDPATKKKRLNFTGRAAFAVYGVLLGIVVGSINFGGDSGTSSASTPAPTVTVTAPASPAPTVTVTQTPKAAASTPTSQASKATSGAATSITKDGTYMVGTDIAPGTYKTSGPRAGTFGGMCYWARLKGTGGELDDIIANDNITGQSTVTIKSSDKAFETSRCETWTKVS